MNCKILYVIQQFLGGYDYTDVYEVTDLRYAKKFAHALQKKFPTKSFRIVRLILYV